MRTDERRVVYTVVALNIALAIWLALTLWMQSAARSSALPMHNQRAFVIDLGLDIVLVLSLLSGAWLELKRRRLAVWLNLVWPLASLIAAPLLALAKLNGDSHRRLVVDEVVISTIPFVFCLILYGILYRLAFRKGLDHHQGAAANRSSKLDTCVLYASVLLFLYPIVTYLLFRTGAIRIRGNDGIFVLLLFLCCPLSVITLIFALRGVGRRKRISVALAAFAITLNGLLVILVGFAY